MPKQLTDHGFVSENDVPGGEKGNRIHSTYKENERKPVVTNRRLLMGLCPGGGTQVFVEYETDKELIGRCHCGSRWWFAVPKKKEKPKGEEGASKALCPCHGEPLDIPFSERDSEAGSGKCAVTGKVFQWRSKPKATKVISKYGDPVKERTFQVYEEGQEEEQE